MSEYISREAVKQLLRMAMKFSLEAMVADPEVITSADVRPNIHAYWIKDDALSVLIDIYRCSNCSSMLGAIHYNFCPKCGAIMDGEPKGEKGTT